MKKMFRVSVIVLAVVLASSLAYATNGDNLIAIGPVARAMGGVGIAAPQDAISAVFANPAAMCFGPYCPSSQFDFAGTLFMPKVKAVVTQNGTAFSADGANKVYSIPAIGVSTPMWDPRWRFGIAAYGVSGLGVNYKGKLIDQPSYKAFGGYPLVSGEYTELAIMKFAPAISYQMTPEISFGLAAHIDYASLDLRNGASANYGIGGQAGMLVKLSNNISLGINYTSPQNVNHDDIADLDHDGNLDRLKLESPMQIGFGIAVDFLNNQGLIEANAKFINWADANGYKEFDWENQWVFALGLQYKPVEKLSLRAGYNYGKNPVKDHQGFVGNSLTSVQGKTMPTYYYETFRIIGFPAVVEHHLTLGFGYELGQKFMLNAGYMHAFSKTINESGTDVTGRPASLQSDLSEDSIDFSMTWRF
jgi:long-chain fatty acid transport protein